MAALGRATPRPTLPADAWPARDVEPLVPLFEATPDRIPFYKIKDGVDPATLSDDERKLVEKARYELEYKGIHGVNLLRLYKRRPPTKSDDFSALLDFGFLFVGFHSNGAIISSRTLEVIEQRRKLDQALAVPVAPDPEKTEKAAEQRIEEVLEAPLYPDSGLPVYIPPAKEGFKPKGLLIHVQSMGANDYEPKVLKEFERRGWAVIDIKPQDYINSPIPESTYEEIRTLDAKLRELRKEIFVRQPPERDKDGTIKVVSMKETVNRWQRHPKYQEYMDTQMRHSKLRQGGFQACSDEDLPRVAAEIAAVIDQGMAGAAYAVETILDYVDTQRPDLQNIPVVLAGFSAGALATPTIAARLEETQPGRIQAVILVGGGCNLFRLAMDSTFSDGGLRVLCGEEPVSKQVIDKLSDLYLAASKLDPYHTSPLISHLPILVLHASRDTWVPAAMGDLLYERLDYPERLVMSGGHEHLFYFLPGRAKWIVDWTERKVQKSSTAGVR